MQLSKKSAKVDKKKLAAALRDNLLRRKTPVKPKCVAKTEDTNKQESK